MPPPMRANSAIDEAPTREARGSTMPSVWPSALAEQLHHSAPMPIRPSPATHSPITAPPSSAITSAAACLARAASVVRTLPIGGGLHAEEAGEQRQERAGQESGRGVNPRPLLEKPIHQHRGHRRGVDGEHLVLAEQERARALADVARDASHLLVATRGRLHAEVETQCDDQGEHAHRDGPQRQTFQHLELLSRAVLGALYGGELCAETAALQSAGSG
jgi:hypothetical protein